MLPAVHQLQVMHSGTSPETTIELVCRYRAQNGETKMTIIGYAASNSGQTLDAQQAALKAAGAEGVRKSLRCQDQQAARRGTGNAGTQGGLLAPVSTGRQEHQRPINVLATISDKGGFRSLAPGQIPQAPMAGYDLILGSLAEFEQSLSTRTGEGRQGRWPVASVR
jgi:hypothetical protein